MVELVVKLLRVAGLIACFGLFACGSASTGARDLALSDLAVPDLAPEPSWCPAIDADGGALSDCLYFTCKPTLADARACQCLGPTGGPPPEAAVCGPYLKLRIFNLDVAVDCYYDEATSTLEAIIGFGNDGTEQCPGATFTPPACQPSFAFCTSDML